MVLRIRPPDCPYGYTEYQIEEIMGPRMEEFRRWMYGQTQMICDGRQYNYEKQEYEPTSCGPYGHGTITYSSDIYLFLAGSDPLD